MATEIISWPNHYERYVARPKMDPMTSWIPQTPHLTDLVGLTRKVSPIICYILFRCFVWNYIWAASWQNPMKWHVCPAKTQISLGICPVWSVFAVRMKKAWVLSYPLSRQRRLIRLGRCPGWSESSLGTHAILLVLSWRDSFVPYNIPFSIVCAYPENLLSYTVCFEL